MWVSTCVLLTPLVHVPLPLQANLPMEQASVPHLRPGRIRSSSTAAAMVTVHSVLQIPHGLGPGARILAGLTRPDKIRHREVAKI